MSGFGFLLNFLYLVCIHGFYVPGVDRLDQVELKNGDLVDVKAVEITSSFHTRLPYEYYSLPLCTPKNETVYESENLGEILMGDRIVNTPYEVRMMENVSCRLLCSKKWSLNEQNIIVNRINNNYTIHLLVNNLPGATRNDSSGIYDGKFTTKLGYKLGFTNDTHVYIHNHLNLIFSYDRVDNQELYRVVGFEMQTASIYHDQLTIMKDDNSSNNCRISMPGSFEGHLQPVFANGDGSMYVYFTYSVTWKPSNISWASRWDAYMPTNDVKFGLLWIVNICVTTALIYFNVQGWRRLRGILIKYNIDNIADKAINRPDRILAQRDVLRPPKYPHFLVATIGSGVQIFLMTVVTIFFAMSGIISPASRGALINCAIFSYATMGGPAGFVSARIYKTIGGGLWKRAAFLTAVLYPGLGFSIYFALNFFMWKENSSDAVPFSTIHSLLTIWFCISLPLVFTGYYIGYKKPPLQNLTPTNQVPKFMPAEQSRYMLMVAFYYVGTCQGGVLDLIGFHMVIESNPLYFSYIYLSVFFFVRAGSCAQLSMIEIYLKLCKKRYRWWWQPSFASDVAGITMIYYTICYFFMVERTYEAIPTLFYFGYSAIMILPYWLLYFTVGFFSSCFFLQKLRITCPLLPKETEMNVILISSE